MASATRIVPLISPMILAGALLAGCTGSVLGTNESTTSGGGGESGASGSGSASAGDGGGGAAESCQALENAAYQQLATVVEQNLACSVDADCTTMLNLGPDGYCAAPCGLLSSVSGAAAVESAANSACQPFLAAGCKPPLLECPAFPPFLCAGGTCATYAVSVTPSPLPALTHGVCAALHLDYSPGAGSPDAPHPIAVLVQSVNATVYADAACTKPVTTGTQPATGTLTIPTGSTGVDFGFLPAAAGGGFIDVGPGIGGGEYSFTAQ